MLSGFLSLLGINGHSPSWFGMLPVILLLSFMLNYLMTLGGENYITRWIPLLVFGTGSIWVVGETHVWGRALVHGQFSLSSKVSPEHRCCSRQCRAAGNLSCLDVLSRPAEITHHRLPFLFDGGQTKYVYRNAMACQTHPGTTVQTASPSVIILHEIRLLQKTSQLPIITLKTKIWSVMLRERICLSNLSKANNVTKSL